MTDARGGNWEEEVEEEDDDDDEVADEDGEEEEEEEKVNGVAGASTVKENDEAITERERKNE